MTKSAFFKISIQLLFCIYATSLTSQTPNFTWVAGADTYNPLAVYGALGTGSVSNIPGARENSVTFVDANNNLWLFGGHGYATTSTQGYLNDLWKFEIATNKWTWVAGANTTNQTNNYGTILVTAASNHPGARQNSHTWADNNGNLWLFGGIGSGSSYYNDLWKFNIATGQWTWMSGTNVVNSSGVYGIQGTASMSNCPPARFGGSVWFENDHLWLFGGQGFTSAQVRYNDLWKYNIATNEWTWVSGSNTTDQNGTYGILGTANAANTPGARQASVTWVDNNNHFYLFGGDGYPASGAMGYMNDLWKYDPTSNQWTWISGTNITAQSGSYGILGIPSATNMPCARQMSISWTDPTGYLYMFGGWGYGGPPFGRMNDLWKYDLNTNQWTWVAGPNSTNGLGTYGILGTGSTTNIPGARRMSISWKDNTNKCWLFGGNGYDHLDSLGLLNDLWKIDIGSTFGMDENDATQFYIYPNPSSETMVVNIEHMAEGEWIEIYNSYGELVQQEMLQPNATIHIGELKAGIYFLRLRSRPGYAKKFIKE